MDLTRLFPNLLRRLQRLLRRRGVEQDEAQDLIQETFLRMTLYCKQGGQVREPEAFVVQTALNLARNARRDAHRELYVEATVEDMVLADMAPTPEEWMAEYQCLERMKGALEAMPERTREVFQLHRLRGLSHSQIAEHFDISVTAVQKHMARAMTSLSERMLQP